MRRLICIEGPDGAGKTTLIEHLRDNSRQYFAVIKASGPPPDKVGAAFTKAAISFATAFPYPVVCDRCHPISEAIYAHVIRGAPMPTIAMVRAQLLEFDLIIYCRPPFERIVANLRQNLQMSGVNEKIGEIVIAYDLLMAQLAQVHEFDYTRDSIDLVRRMVFDPVPVCARCRSPDHHVADCEE